MFDVEGNDLRHSDSSQSPNSHGGASTVHTSLIQRIVRAVPNLRSAAIGTGKDAPSFWEFTRPPMPVANCASIPEQLSERDACNKGIFIGETQDENDVEDGFY